jgi:hypothetical protein
MSITVDWMIDAPRQRAARQALFRLPSPSSGSFLVGIVSPAPGSYLVGQDPGLLVKDNTYYRWGRHAEMRICQLNASWHISDRMAMTDTMHFRLDHFVLAKRYIEARVKA